MRSIFKLHPTVCGIFCFILTICNDESINTVIRRIPCIDVISYFCSVKTITGGLILAKLLIFVITYFFVFLFSLVYKKFIQTSKTITFGNSEVEVKYGNLLKEDKSKNNIVINFDECYSTRVGNGPSDIKKDSICGQFLLLKAKNNFGIAKIIKESKIQPLNKISKFKNQIRYQSGTIIPYEDYYLMAFANLNENGKAIFDTRQDYYNSLFFMWSEIYNNFNYKNVCIPVLGAGVTVIENNEQISSQDLLDIILITYRLSPYKIKSPYKLKILCMKNEIDLSKILSYF